MTSPRGGRRRRETGPAERTPDQRLATLHLRTGSLSLARTELETMAGDGLLDDEALLDLAEVRWRTGDLPGAGEAADAFLGAGHETTLGLVIAAEAQAALGRPVEARRLADRAIRRSDRSLDVIFAGLPVSSIWPRDVDAEILPQPAPIAPGSPRLGSSGAHDGAEGRARDARDRREGPAGTGSVAEGAHPSSPSSAILPDVSMALQAAEEALASDDPSAATIQLALVLRVAPALAPAVLDMIRDQEGASFELIRGDAYRLVGREAEARRSFAAAAGTSGAQAAETDGAAEATTEADATGEPAASRPTAGPARPTASRPTAAPAEPDGQLSIDNLEAP
jgi:hypothetical protein